MDEKISAKKTKQDQNLQMSVTIFLTEMTHNSEQLYMHANVITAKMVSKFSQTRLYSIIH
jgi:hypothetical protein